MKSVHMERILVVVAGLWHDKSWMAKRRVFHRNQIQNYREMCEIGFSINITYLTYSNLNLSSTWVEDLQNLLCFRDSSSLTSSMAYVKKEPLPKGYMGTSGTLQFYHRKIFFDARNEYDLFVFQEDDMLIELRNVLYFLRWSKILKEPFVPGFAKYESLQIRNTRGELKIEASVGWMKNFYIFQMDGRYMLSGKYDIIVAPMYMISKEILGSLPVTWSTVLPEPPQNASVEFNPYFGSGRWFGNRFKVLIPVKEFSNVLIHHQPDKYFPIFLERAEALLASKQRADAIQAAMRGFTPVWSQLQQLLKQSIAILEGDKSDYHDPKIDYMGHCKDCGPRALDVSITRDSAKLEQIRVKVRNINKLDMRWAENTICLEYSIGRCIK